LVADWYCIVRILLRMRDGRVKPGHDGEHWYQAIVENSPATWKLFHLPTNCSALPAPPDVL
jgi:hypothetical protein